MEAHHWEEYLRIVIIVSLIGAIQGQTATVTGPEGGAIERGRDVVLRCPSDVVQSGSYIWTDGIGPWPVQIVVNGGTTNAHPKYSNFVSSPPGDKLNITAATVEDEGYYQCLVLVQANITGYALNVEVGSTPTMTLSTTDPLRAGTEYTATCDVVGSRPQLDISWTFNDIPLGVTPVVTNPTNTDPDLSDTRSEITFTATTTMNGQDLKCTTSGHVVTSLNSAAAAQLNVQYAPTIDTATIAILEPSKEGDKLRVSCQISPVVGCVDPANPAINNYTIYAGSEQIHSSTTDHSVLVDISENVTDYKCTAGNDLGIIWSEAVNYDPGSSTAAPPSPESSQQTSTVSEPSTSGPGSPTTTTVATTAAPSSPESCQQTSAVSGPSEDVMSCSCLSPGAMAGMVVLAVLLTIAVCINIVQFVLSRTWRRDRYTRGQPAGKREKKGGQDTALKGNDNQTYEMVQSSGNEAAYTSQILAKQGEVSPATDDMLFFSRLGSIGRGEFGHMWTGALRSKQWQLPVAIRCVPDHVTKSSNIDQSSKILSKLPNHPHVVTCIGHCVGKSSLLYELIPGGSLLTHLQTSGGQSAPTYSNLKSTRVNLEESNLLKFAWQVAKGMDFLASRKIIHGALCAHNVLMTEEKQCKISDYGLASIYGINIKPTRWSSPEAMKDSACSVEGDIWSYGIVLWEITTFGARPYPKMTDDIVQREVTQGYKMPCPQHCGQELYAIMNGCWEKDPQNRSTFQQILKKLEHLMEKEHEYLVPNKLDEGLYELAS